ncbi:hypothetical protein [Acidithrix ferrooxidans]|uniref:hypothetical protein n=1 Tax=Acidithrix ferrooxidans TaxID=1280514 RepID=UPI0006960D49|nr:hypothetical protein [Acidithrix ferrooxidans]
MPQETLHCEGRHQITPVFPLLVLLELQGMPIPQRMPRGELLRARLARSKASLATTKRTDRE